MYLSKSDFKLASSCAKKLIYKKLSYHTANDTNEFIEMLAQGGHVVGKMAQLMYSGGIEIPSDKGFEYSILETERIIREKEEVILFEATVFNKNRLIKIDILEKKGNVVNLIEVKSKSYDSDDEPSIRKKTYNEYIEDVVFQSIVLKDAFPDYTVHSYLLMPDKAKRTTIEGLAGWFTTAETVSEDFDCEELSAQNSLKFHKPKVRFIYEDDPARDKYIDLLINDNLLSLVLLDEQVECKKSEIENRANLFLEILRNGIKKDQYTPNKSCKVCEFQLEEIIERNGYRECWELLTDVTPHIFDLYYGGALGSSQKGWYLDELIKQKRVSLWDIDTERLKNAKGELGSRAQRQLIQLQNTRDNTEWVSDLMKDALDSLVYPLHFIDFETYTGAVPFHKGMRPYEMIAFQWSCLTVKSTDAEPVHSEWINLEYDFPNFLFAESLMDQIGYLGTPLMWATHENTVLRQILEQMETFGYQNAQLKAWLMYITKDKEVGREGKFVDMNAFTIEHYFHPFMKGRTSIKKVLPAIWNNNKYLHQIPWFNKYSRIDINGSINNPYDTLSPTINQMENLEVVKDGTGAMRAYYELMFGSISKNEIHREELRKLLLQYCELDTMAMVIIWKYWMDKCKLAKS